jgi:Nucleotidyl transferase AbiEii toxin, Type IV TA system
MRQLEQVAREVVAWLETNQIGYALIGGLAVSFRSIERFTKDIDLVIAVENDQQAESYVRQLAGFGYQVQLLLEQTKHGRIATVRLIKIPGGSVFVDLLFSSSGVETEIVAGAEPIELFKNFSLRVASLAGLLALKVLAADSNKRPQDLIDIKNLLAEATTDDVQEAVRLLQLIQQRGFNRGKNLLVDFEKYRL